MENTNNKSAPVSTQVVGNSGLYYVCYRLSRLGWNVMPTARNAKGIDVLMYNHNASSKLSIQVKALSKRAPVPLGTKLEHFFADWVVICRYVHKEKPECFILTSDEVKRLAHKATKEDKDSYWLQPPAYESDKYLDAWTRIGRGDLTALELPATDHFSS
jgi:hypothetical protein